MLLKNHPIKLDVVPDYFDILQKGILEMDFLKKCRPIGIRCDVQGFANWRDITISCTTQDSVVIPAKSTKLFYIKESRSQDGTNPAFRP
jgi:hypothetical protein